MLREFNINFNHIKKLFENNENKQEKYNNIKIKQ